MVTLTIEFDDATYARLKRAADERAMGVERYVAEVMERTSEPEDVSDEFRAISRELIETYRPVFHRLAQ